MTTRSADLLMPKSLRSIVRFASACSDAIRKRSFFATSRSSVHGSSKRSASGCFRQEVPRPRAPRVAEPAGPGPGLARDLIARDARGAADRRTSSMDAASRSHLVASIRIGVGSQNVAVGALAPGCKDAERVAATTAPNRLRLPNASAVRNADAATARRVRRWRFGPEETRGKTRARSSPPRSRA
jgi:hypothetical protein